MVDSSLHHDQKTVVIPIRMTTTRTYVVILEKWSKQSLLYCSFIKTAKLYHNCSSYQCSSDNKTIHLDNGCNVAVINDLLF